MRKVYITIAWIILSQLTAVAQDTTSIKLGATSFFNTTLIQFKVANFSNSTTDYYEDSYARVAASYAVQLDVKLWPDERVFVKTGIRLKHSKLIFEPDEVITMSALSNINVRRRGVVNRFDLTLPWLIGRTISDRTSFFLGPNLTYHVYTRTRLALLDEFDSEVSSSESNNYDFEIENINIYFEGGFAINFLEKEKFDLSIQPVFSLSVFPIQDSNEGAAVQTYLHQAGIGLGILFN